MNNHGESTIQIAFNEGTIIFDRDIITQLGEGAGFTIKEVPKSVADILAILPSSDFYFGEGEKVISNLPGKPIEYLKPTTPRSTIAKAIWKYRTNMKKAA